MSMALPPLCPRIVPREIECAVSDNGRPRGRASVGRPGPEFLRVAYGPDVADPAADDLERHHRLGDAVTPRHQAGLAVDRAFQERDVGLPGGDVEHQASDLLR